MIMPDYTIINISDMKTAEITKRNSSKFLAILMVFALITPGISAQKSLDNYLVADLTNEYLASGKKEIIAALEHHPRVSTNDMNMEDWMKEPFDWNNTEALSPASIPYNFNEEPLEFEDWMVRTNWSREFDQEPELESWMSDPFSWTIKK